MENCLSYTQLLSKSTPAYVVIHMIDIITNGHYVVVKGSDVSVIRLSSPPKSTVTRLTTSDHC